MTEEKFSDYYTLRQQLDDDKAYLIRPDDSFEEVTPNNDTNFQLWELYNLLDCDTIEVIYKNKKRIMIIDGDGECKQDLVNYFATSLMRNIIASDDAIVGYAILCPTKMLK